MSDNPMTKWYSVCSYSSSDSRVIETVDAVAETDKFLVLLKPNGSTRREAKQSDYRRWFRTPSEALDDAIAHDRREQETERLRIDTAQKRIDRYERIKAELEGQC